MGESQGYDHISEETMENASNAAKALETARATNTPWEHSTREGNDYNDVRNMQEVARAMDAARELGIDPALVESHRTETRAAVEDYMQAKSEAETAARAAEEANVRLEAARAKAIASADQGKSRQE